jgi:alanine dehydrogenase
LANKGWLEAVQQNPGLKNGLNVYLGEVTNQCVAEDLGYTYVSPDEVVNSLVTAESKQRVA